MCRLYTTNLARDRSAATVQDRNRSVQTTEQTATEPIIKPASNCGRSCTPHTRPCLRCASQAVYHPYSADYSASMHSTAVSTGLVDELMNAELTLSPRGSSNHRRKQACCARKSAALPCIWPLQCSLLFCRSVLTLWVTRWEACQSDTMCSCDQWRWIRKEGAAVSSDHVCWVMLMCE